MYTGKFLNTHKGAVWSRTATNLTLKAVFLNYGDTSTLPAMLAEKWGNFSLRYKHRYYWSYLNKLADTID